MILYSKDKKISDKIGIGLHIILYIIVRIKHMKASKFLLFFNCNKNIFYSLFRISLTEFLKSFHRFNVNQQYLIDLTSSTVMRENNYVDEICADLLSAQMSELPVDHDRGECEDFSKNIFTFFTAFKNYIF